MQLFLLFTCLFIKDDIYYTQYRFNGDKTVMTAMPAPCLMERFIVPFFSRSFKGEKIISSRKMKLGISGADVLCCIKRLLCIQTVDMSFSGEGVF